MRASLLALLGGAATALASVKGFNYASQGQTYDSFKSQFQQAASLSGADDFTSARLYTMIQDGTTNTVISAIQAAIDTKTTLLLGLWASQDQAGFSNEITALKSAIAQHGSALTDLVIGISVGSEDLYRISPTGIAAGSGVGQAPSVLVDYIAQTRTAIQGTALGSTPVGHVDTWNVYVNGTNSPVIAAADFLGLDEYPYYQTTDTNGIDNAGFLFFQAYDRVNAVAQGKPIWITESGWPVSGPTSNLAVASVSNAAEYWQVVACELEHRNIDTWWYILADAGASPSFGVSQNGQPLYNLACNASSGYTASSSSSASSSASATSASSASGHSVTMTSVVSSSGKAVSTMTFATSVAGGSASATATASAYPNPHSAVSSAAGASGSGSATASSSSSKFTGAASSINGQASTGVFTLLMGAVAAILAL